MQISETWDGIVVNVDDKLAVYTNSVPDGSVGVEFLDLLMFGIPSAELENFLLQELTEKGLKKLNGNIDSSYLNVQRLVVKYLHMVSQSLNFFLGELLGLALANEKLEVIIVFRFFVFIKS